MYSIGSITSEITFSFSIYVKEGYELPSYVLNYFSDIRYNYIHYHGVIEIRFTSKDSLTKQSLFKILKTKDLIDLKQYITRY